jgi:ribosomal protein S2
MEKRGFRMGVICKKSFPLNDNQLSDFLFSQSYWGHKKQYLNHSLNKHVLGLKNDFVVFNNQHFLEYSNRCSFFCFNTVYSGGNVFFVSSEDVYKKLTLFFTSRSFQYCYVDKWFGGLITNNLLGGKAPDIFVVSNLKQDTFILKEALNKLVPVICIEDSDHSLHKSFYSSFANDDKKDSIHFFFGIITDSILKSLLFKYSKSLIFKV